MIEVQSQRLGRSTTIKPNGKVEVVEESHVFIMEAKAILCFLHTTMEISQKSVFLDPGPLVCALGLIRVHFHLCWGYNCRYIFVLCEIVLTGHTLKRLAQHIRHALKQNCCQYISNVTSFSINIYP